MKITKGLLLFGVLVVVASSCFDPPEYPNTPRIGFSDIYFGQTTNNSSGLDSLVLSITFQDGDGDLGLSSDVSSDPYHPANYFLARNGNLEAISTFVGYTANGNFYSPIINVHEGQSGKLVTVKTSDDPNYPSLPDYTFPYTCTSYIYDTLYLQGDNLDIIDDTYNIVDTVLETNPRLYRVAEIFYYQPNQNTYNITVDFLIKTQIGPNNFEFREFDWETVANQTGDCTTNFDGRFTVLSNESGPLEGTLRYSMKSEGFLIVLGASTFKLRIQIRDRALNLSNIIETPELTLEGIRR